MKACDVNKNNKIMIRVTTDINNYYSNPKHTNIVSTQPSIEGWVLTTGSM